MDQILSSKLHSLTIRLTELASIINISRPTLYKYLEAYEKGSYRNLQIKVKELFDFIVSENCSSRHALYLYVFKGENSKGIKREIIDLVEPLNDQVKLKKILSILKGE
jgi:hypothetical protein